MQQALPEPRFGTALPTPPGSRPEPPAAAQRPRYRGAPGPASCSRRRNQPHFRAAAPAECPGPTPVPAAPAEDGALGGCSRHPQPLRVARGSHPTATVAEGGESAPRPLRGGLGRGAERGPEVPPVPTQRGEPGCRRGAGEGLSCPQQPPGPRRRPPPASRILRSPSAPALPAHPASWPPPPPPLPRPHAAPPRCRRRQHG